MNKYQNLTEAKSSLLAKAQRKLANNFPDYEFDEDLLGDYFDDAVSILQKWLKNSNESLITRGNYDTEIVEFIIESLGRAGLEGQMSSSANGISKTFIATPESNLKSKIPQSL